MNHAAAQGRKMVSGDMLGGSCQILIDGSHIAGVVTVAAGHSILTALDTSDLTKLMALLPEAAWPNTKFYGAGYGASPTFLDPGTVTRQQLTPYHAADYATP